MHPLLPLSIARFTVVSKGSVGVTVKPESADVGERSLGLFGLPGRF